jgi:uncharacterized protein YdeI (YjbR/CyaY-like superfamily)
MKSVDEGSYIKYFKQRRAGSNWSDKNKKLVAMLEEKKLMTDFGRAKIAEAKQNGEWDAPPGQTLTEEQLQEFDSMIQPYEISYANWQKMSLSVRKAYASSYFFGAKTDEGRQKRFDTMK